MYSCKEIKKKNTKPFTTSKIVQYISRNINFKQDFPPPFSDTLIYNTIYAFQCKSKIDIDSDPYINGTK